MEKSEYESLIVKYYPNVMNYCMKLCKYNRPDAEDLCHQVMLKALTRPPVSTHSLLSWLLCITYNEHVNNYKHKQLNPADSYETLYQGTIGPDQYTKLEYDQAMGIINGSRKWSTKALKMYAEGFLYREIAETLNRNIETVKTGIHTQRMKLKKDFGRVA